MSSSVSKILYFADGVWATNSLRRLLDEGQRVVGVVLRTKPSDPGLAELAQACGIPVHQPANIGSPEFLETVRRISPDLLVSVSFNQIFKKKLLGLAPGGAVNFHSGKLPLYRGRNVVNWAIINGETEIGMTAHCIDEDIDTGDIILQKTLPILWTDTYGDVLNKLFEAFPSLVSEAITLISSRGRACGDQQKPGLGTYFAGREEPDEWLDWSETSTSLYNKIRGITRPGPGARTLVGDDVVRVWKASYDPSWPKYKATPGQVVGRIKNRGVIVKTGDSTILLEEVQSQGSSPLTPDWKIGTRLGVNLAHYVHVLERRVRELERKLKIQHV